MSQAVYVYVQTTTQTAKCSVKDVVAAWYL